MKTKPTKQPDDPEQSKRFIETAKKIEADEDPKAFDAVFKTATRRSPAAKNSKP